MFFTDVAEDNNESSLIWHSPKWPNVARPSSSRHFPNQSPESSGMIPIKCSLHHALYDIKKSLLGSWKLLRGVFLPRARPRSLKGTLGLTLAYILISNAMQNTYNVGWSPYTLDAYYSSIYRVGQKYCTITVFWRNDVFPKPMLPHKYIMSIMYQWSHHRTFIGIYFVSSQSENEILLWNRQ